MTALPSAPGTSTQIMNMTKSRSSTASTISTILNPIKKTLGIKKRFSKRGTNALFRAISAENWELVCTICDSKPYKAEAWHNAVGFFDAHRSSKILPLHQACIFHPTKDAIVHIIQAYPYALHSKETGYGRVPLHIACHSNASLACIEVLVEHHPSATTEQDIIGRVPLHYALSNGASYDIVKTLMDAAVRVSGRDGLRYICSVADFNGWLPIHVACFMGASAQVLSELVNAYPEGVDAETKKRSTPGGLLKAITMSPQKKNVLESILLTKGDTDSPYASRPARTNIEKVVRMSDETCSKGVTLEIDEDETSSLSSMEVSTKTGLTRKSKSRKRLTYDEYNKANGSAGANQLIVMNRSPQLVSSYRSPSTPQLPTHSIYEQQDHASESMQVGVIRYGYNEASKSSRSDLFFAPAEKKHLRQESKRRNNSLPPDSTKSQVSTDDEESYNVIFQPITSTA
eukprot:CAMPEP_0203695234 /NCGR_PEP_ID=MMETSP0091-20130426/6743_1 /ASSEMBLY_ACC=CAM_ASM_001089 /TAXON_ID=426623 /ORGANISM="Chaetoceros affinis, Strain CCMP159" /LENGTH=457 /DNA_ID=CAMNT_0050566741 /DNA_START=144 /DNA_END=1514 /DNA_ORIENTATION=+